MAKLINGDGNKAIWAQQDADLIASLAGNVTAIADVGSKFAATQEDANTIGLADGVIVTKEGRRIQLDVGNVDLFDIPTGTTGVTSYYIIGYHLYTESDSSQVCETFVQKMDNATDVITENTFRGGATEVYVSCYRVTQIGMNIDTIVGLLPKLSNLSGDSDKIGTESGSIGAYDTVTIEKISYDETNKQLILKVDGADTPVPFSGESFEDLTVDLSYWFLNYPNRATKTVNGEIIAVLWFIGDYPQSSFGNCIAYWDKYGRTQGVYQRITVTGNSVSCGSGWSTSYSCCLAVIYKPNS